LYALIALCAALENFFPPLPADTVVALGAFLAGRGSLDPWIVFGIVWVANVGGAATLYGLARRYGRPLFQGRFGRRLLPESVLAHLERQYDRHGAWGIFLSRLLPVWRGVVTPFAGIAGLRPGRALPPVALASAVWYGGLTAVVVRLAPSLDAMLAQLGRVNRVLGAIAVLAVAAVAFVAWRKLKR
jgi:membrane protein DedA with SNARE-associated domain